MKIELKNIIFFQSAIILLLLLSMALLLFTNSFAKPSAPSGGLISPRIYTGLLEPKNYLIINFEPLEQTLRKEIGTRNISIYIQNLRDGSEMSINGDTRFIPLSLSKIPLAILILQKVERGELTMDTLIPVSQQDKQDFRDKDLYPITEDLLPLRILLEKMLKESDNIATVTLSKYINERDLNLLYDYYSLTIDYSFNRKNNDSISHLITPKIMSNIFTSLYLSTLLDAKDSEYILQLLTNTILDIKSIAHLPPEIILSHKFGINYLENTQVFHDCGILYFETSRISYCIMTKNIEPEELPKTIGTIINQIYTYTVNERNRLNNYKTESSD